MAITTLENAIAGMTVPFEFAKGVTGTMAAGRPQSLFYLAGSPAAATAPAIGIGGTQLTTYAGQLPFANPPSGNTYLARFQAMATAQGGTLLLCDRLWHNSGINMTLNTEQTFTSSADIPARDANGAALGAGVYAGVEVVTVTGAGTPTLTLKYTNSAGTPDQTATNLVATSATAIAGSFYPIGLAAGDVGIRNAQSLTLSATWTSGAISVVLYRVLARLELSAAAKPNAIDAFTAGFPRAYDNTVPFLIFIPNTTTTTSIQGQVIWTQG